MIFFFFFFFSSRRRHTRYIGDWSSDVCSSDLAPHPTVAAAWHGGSPIGHAALGVADSADANYRDRKSTRLNSSHRCTSYDVFCLKKKNESEAFKKVISRRNIRRRITIQLTLSN